MLCFRAVCVTKWFGFDLGELLSSVQRQAGIAVSYSAWVKDSFKQRLFGFESFFLVQLPGPCGGQCIENTTQTPSALPHSPPPPGPSHWEQFQLWQS